MQCFKGKRETPEDTNSLDWEIFAKQPEGKKGVLNNQQQLERRRDVVSIVFP